MFILKVFELLVKILCISFCWLDFMNFEFDEFGLKLIDLNMLFIMMGYEVFGVIVVVGFDCKGFLVG